MAEASKAPGTKLIAQNRKARHDYFVEDTVEAGLSARRHGGEVL